MSEWKLVPVEPTKEMLLAGCEAADALGTPLTRTRNAYAAMLAAAPDTPAVQAEPVACKFSEDVELLIWRHNRMSKTKYAAKRQHILRALDYMGADVMLNGNGGNIIGWTRRDDPVADKLAEALRNIADSNIPDATDDYIEDVKLYARAALAEWEQKGGAV